MNYRAEVIRGMQLLARQPNVVFVGQGTVVKANCLFEQLEGTCSRCKGNGRIEMLEHCPDCKGKPTWCVPSHQRLEVPVFENTQLGMCLGMSLAGLLPVCLFPRTNFLLLAVDQLVNHLDKWQQMTGKPAKVIVKTMTGTTRPLDPGPQHSDVEGEHAGALDALCETIKVYDLWGPELVYESYEAAAMDDGPTLLVERGNLYG